MIGGLKSRAHLGASDLQASPLSEGNGELWESYIKRRVRVQAESPTAGFRFGFPHDPSCISLMIREDTNATSSVFRTTGSFSMAALSIFGLRTQRWEPAARHCDSY